MGVDWVLCQTCYAMLPKDVRAQRLHEEWHAQTAQVAIENTRRIQELEDGHRGD